MMIDKKIQGVSADDSMSPSRGSTVLGVQRAHMEQIGNSSMGSPLGAAATGAALGILSSQNTKNAHTTPMK